MCMSHLGNKPSSPSQAFRCLQATALAETLIATPWETSQRGLSWRDPWWVSPHGSLPWDGGAWKAAVHGVTEGRTRLSDFTLTFYFQALEKEMATHSSVLAWRIPGMGKPGALSSMGSHRVGHDWSNLAAAAAERPPSQGHWAKLLLDFWCTNLVWE